MAFSALLSCQEPDPSPAPCVFQPSSLVGRCRIEEAVQAIKEADALAFRKALPKQLKLCEQLLDELWALPMGDLFHQQWVSSDIRAALGCARTAAVPFLPIPHTVPFPWMTHEGGTGGV